MPARKGHPGGCTVCAHLERGRIELLLAGAAGQKAVASKFGLSKDSVHRHWHTHVSEERRLTLIMGPVQRQALVARLAEENSSVIDNLKAVRAGLYQLYSAAVDAGDRNGGALVAGKLHENLRIAGRINGDLASSPLVTINNSQTNVTALMESPQFTQFQARLIAILARHPAARDEVVREFEQLEREHLERATAPAVPVPALEHEHAVA